MSTGADIQLQLCGHVALRHGALQVDLPDAIAGYLLACLGARGDWMLREELVALFWPEAAEADGQRNLRVTLNRLRDKLQSWGVAEALATERRRIRWLPGSDVTRARASRAQGDWESVNRVLAASGGGRFLPSFSFRGYPLLADWAEGERQAVQALAREAVLSCSALAAPAAAAAMAGRQLDSDPADEDLMRTRLQALASLGRHEDVAHEFAAFDARMRRDMGAPASAALAALAVRLGPRPLLRGASSGAMSATAARAATGAAAAEGEVDGVDAGAVDGVGHADGGHAAAVLATDYAAGSLVAREREWAQVRGLLQQHRLVTLTGLGGVGKTHLARAVASSSQVTLWLALADVVAVSDIAHRVAPALGLPATPARDPVAAAGALLAGRVQLLVLDNLEQFQAQRAELQQLLTQWLAAAPALVLLATSREPLGHAAEKVLQLQPLAWQAFTDTVTPPDAVTPSPTRPQHQQAPGVATADSAGAARAARAANGRLSSPALRLLVAQVQRLRPGFDARLHEAHLVQIAQQVGGLPLALQLAAQWLRVLGPADVLASLRQGITGLDADVGAAAPAPLHGLSPSQQAAKQDASLSKTLWRSWRLLDNAAQRALATLSVRVSPFTAEAVLQSGAATLPTLARLLDHGLLQQDEDPPRLSHQEASAHPTLPSQDQVPIQTPHSPAQRLQLHPLVRSFAAERLAGDPQAERQARQAHAAWVLQQLGPWLNWRQVDQRQALLSIAALLPEAMVAWQWALAQGDVHFVATAAPVLCHYYEAQGRWSEGIGLFEAAESNWDVDEPTERAALAALARSRALLLYRDGRFDAAETLALRALVWAREMGHGVGIKACLNTLALARWMQGRVDEALAAASEAHTLASADGDRAGQAVFAGTLGLLHKRRGDYAAAMSAYRDALAVHREVGNWRSAGTTLNNIGNLLRVLGKPDEAVLALDESLRLCDAYGFASSRPVALVNLAQAHLVAGRPDVAEPLALQALEESRRSGERLFEAATLLLLAEMALRGQHLQKAAAHLAPALRAARAIDDPANLLEALACYARWCHAQGRNEAAAEAFATVLAQPKVHAELREDLQNSPLAQLTAQAAVNQLLLVERASAELAAFV